MIGLVDEPLIITIDGPAASGKSSVADAWPGVQTADEPDFAAVVRAVARARSLSLSLSGDAKAGTASSPTSTSDRQRRSGFINRMDASSV